MKNDSKKGYAIMFTVILVSIISLIGIGLSNITYKQLLLSSGAKDSQTAFYMSDMATECALYADTQRIFTGDTPPPYFPCGIDADNNSYTMNYESIDSNGSYRLIPDDGNSLNPCFRIIIEKTPEGEAVSTKIQASGYNICNTSNSRTVERTIEVTY